MNHRILLKEIPARTFHSAVFTTFSINLYYLEQQVLPFLSSKGINYISILADSNMLSMQLEQYGHLSQPRKRHYSIQGIPSSGAFHSKMIFLTGQNSVLLLLGSGNLTSSGHGKNLEVWNPVFVESIEDPRAGFVLQAWNYLKALHDGLGSAAQNKLHSIEEHCHLLSNNQFVSTNLKYLLPDKTNISFLSNQPGRSIFQQMVNIVGETPIDTITIMSPFHDRTGRFITALNRQFSPTQVRVLLQKNFGNAPSLDPIPPNVKFYDWKQVLQNEIKQPHFHAKNIILSGPQTAFLISGSANASLAAFGTTEISPTNEECCILYESSTLDFHELLNLTFEVPPISVDEYIDTHQPIEATGLQWAKDAFIVSAGLDGDLFSMTVHIYRPLENATLALFEAPGHVAYSQIVSWKEGVHEVKYEVPNGIHVLSVQLLSDSNPLSNIQFVTDLHAFESKNPSPQNRSLNHIRNLIESGNFNSLHIIEYYRTMATSKGKPSPELVSSQPDTEESTQTSPTPEELVYMSYEEIHERSKSIPTTEYARAYSQYAGIRILDSIQVYKKDARESALEADIDEEETENATSSEGRSAPKKKSARKAITFSKFERNQKKTLKFFNDYLSILEKKISDPHVGAPTLIDLSMYLITMEVLLHLVDHTEHIENNKEDQEHETRHLLALPFSKTHPSWTQFMLRCVGLFSVWSAKSSGIMEMQNVDYMLKLERFKTQALHTNIAVLSIAKLVNETFDQPSLDVWILQSLLNNQLIFNTNQPVDSDAKEILSYIPQTTIEDIGEELLLLTIRTHCSCQPGAIPSGDSPKVGEYFYVSNLGFSYIDKVLPSPPRIFLKLFSLGFNWDPDSENYWNKKVYSVTDQKWMKTNK